jgi:hypothetical protein
MSLSTSSLPACRVIPKLVLETFIAIDHREHIQKSTQALWRLGIEYQIMPDTGMLLTDRKSGQSIGFYTQPEVWTLIHLLDGVFDPVLREGY